MMHTLFSDMTLRSWQGDMYRNIVSIRESQDLFDDLTNSTDGVESAIALIEMVKPINQISERPIIERPFEDAKFRSVIDYPFTHWQKSRYSDGTFGVWYGAADMETTVFETVHHWKNWFLKDAGYDQLDRPIRGERRVHTVHCDAMLLDFCPKIAKFPDLVAKDSYSMTMEIGKKLSHDGHPGLISISARCDGEVMAIFTPKVLSNPRPFCYLTYILQGDKVKVERAPGKTLLII